LQGAHYPGTPAARGIGSVRFQVALSKNPDNTNRHPKRRDKIVGIEGERESHLGFQTPDG